MTSHILQPPSPLNRQNNIAFILWVVFFCYASCTALIFQKLLLPFVASLQTGSGLISNDAVYFDSVASSLADEIRTHGWGVWELYPAEGAPGNVGILAALYALFGHDPSLVIPINAALHASGGLLIYLLACELANNKSIGNFAGVIAGGLFVIFPSALVWYGQNHKDSYFIAGMLLVLLVWVKAIKNPSDNRTWCWLYLGNLVGITLVGIVRPFGLKLLLIASGMALLTVIVSAISLRKIRAFSKLMGFFLIVTVTIISADKTTLVLGGLQSDTTYAKWNGRVRMTNGTYKTWQWVHSPWLPKKIEDYIETAARTRVGLIAYGESVNAKSMIDENIVPENLEETAIYLPRALQVALLAPFPSSWLTNISMTRLVAVGEMFIYYLCAPGILILLYYNRKPAVLMSIYFACFFLLVYGFTQANLGTLYRYRYGYFFVMLMLGVLGWVTWLDRTGRLQKLLYFLRPHADSDPSPESTAVTDHPAQRKQIIGSGFIVIVLTLLCFIGFFFRDILMAQTFGLGSALDNFFIALLIPMFIVTVLCMPLGTVFIPIYLGAKGKQNPYAAQALVSSVSFWTSAFLLIVCIALYLIGPNLLPLFYFKKSPPDMEQIIPLLDIALPILFFSGIVILGNAVLNASGRAVLTSVAQLIVPITAIGFLLLFGRIYGVKAVMFGMVTGQLLNLAIVQYYLKSHDISLLPRFNLPYQPKLSPLLQQYSPLVVSAFFVAVAAPVATLLAITLPEGSVSAFNLGNKVVLFITGLVNTAISTVMLPYFSRLVTKNHLVSARNELSFFLLFATFVSIPISAVLFIWSEPIIRLLFEHGTFNKSSTELVTRVMQYSVVQLPFFVSNSLLLKFATATKHVYAITAVAIIGLLVNIGVSILLMNYMGVAGIALGASVSMLSSTVLLVLVLVRYWHISKLDALIILLNWMLFLTLLLGLHFQSAPSAYATAFAYAVLLIGYFSTLKSDRFSFAWVV